MNIALTTQETLGLMKDSLAKNVTISTGLTAYDLQAPAKNLYPTITPLRNSIPRVARLNPGDAAHWRSIFSTTGSGFAARSNFNGNLIEDKVAGNAGSYAATGSANNGSAFDGLGVTYGLNNNPNPAPESVPWDIAAGFVIMFGRFLPIIARSRMATPSRRTPPRARPWMKFCWSPRRVRCPPSIRNNFTSASRAGANAARSLPMTATCFVRKSPVPVRGWRRLRPCRNVISSKPFWSAAIVS